MRKIIIVLVGILLVVSTFPVMAQGDSGESPACTPEELTPIAELVTAIYRDVEDQRQFTVEAMLHWRGQLTTLALPNCAGSIEIGTQLQIAADELLIAALLMERPGTPTETAADAMNVGLVNLVGLRYALPAVSDDAVLESVEPDMRQIDAEALLNAFETANLNIADIEAEDDLPEGATQGYRFDLPAVFDGGIGYLWAFETWTTRNQWADDLRTSDDTPGYIFVHENIVLQLSPELTASAAQGFWVALSQYE